MKRLNGTNLQLKRMIAVMVLTLFFYTTLICQVVLPRYRITLSDKNNSKYSVDKPAVFLSERAIERRQRHNVPVTVQDIPVSNAYLEQIKKTGAKVICTSKWFNTAIVELKDSSLVQVLSALPFISSVEQVYFPDFEKKTQNKFSPENEEFVTNQVDISDYGYAIQQIAAHNGQWLHDQGYRGSDVKIAVIDAGFYKVNSFPVFSKLWSNQKVIGARDIVNPGSNIYQQHSHGMKVLSIIAGNIPEVYVGTAPDASFWLIRSEDGFSEFIVEEDYWVAAAELADSAGIDVINTSLGYSLFDNPEQNHTYADMNGTSTIISKAATIAASKGIIPVISAGNSGNDPWGYITAPADAENILAVGAITVSSEIATFSSRGPSSDGRVKPDVVATGQGTYIQSTSESDIVRGNGTSFSAPVIAGLTACLLQAFPNKTNKEIMRAIIQSSSRYIQPDTAYGYGIPDYKLAHQILSYSDEEKEGLKVLIQPNPITDHIEIDLLFLPDTNEKVVVNVFDLQGRLVIKEHFPASNTFTSRYLPLPGTMSNGIYLVRVLVGNQSETVKILKTEYGN